MFIRESVRKSVDSSVSPYIRHTFFCWTNHYAFSFIHPGYSPSTAYSICNRVVVRNECVAAHLAPPPSPPPPPPSPFGDAEVFLTQVSLMPTLLRIYSALKTYVALYPPSFIFRFILLSHSRLLRRRRRRRRRNEFCL